jgi:hypothetical protein
VAIVVLQSNQPNLTSCGWRMASLHPSVLSVPRPCGVEANRTAGRSTGYSTGMAGLEQGGFRCFIIYGLFRSGAARKGPPLQSYFHALSRRRPRSPLLASIILFPRRQLGLQTLPFIPLLLPHSHTASFHSSLKLLSSETASALSCLCDPSCFALFFVVSSGAACAMDAVLCFSARISRRISHELVLA